MKHKYVIYLNCNNTLDILVIIVNCKFCSFLKLYDLHYLVLIFSQGRKDVVQIFNNMLRRQIGARAPTVEHICVKQEILTELMNGYNSFLAHLAKGHVSFCHHLASVVVRRKLSHLNLLLWNSWTKLNQTWQGWSLGESLSKLCPTALPSIQDGCCY